MIFLAAGGERSSEIHRKSAFAGKADNRQGGHNDC